jgi:hypothetical protein
MSGLFSRSPVRQAVIWTGITLAFFIPGGLAYVSKRAYEKRKEENRVDRQGDRRERWAGRMV